MRSGPTQEANPIFPGLAPERWRSFEAHCSYRWQSVWQQGYRATYCWQGARYYVPYRLGYEKSEGCQVTSEIEQVMAWCLASRHNDGRERERALRQLLDCADLPFVIPYLLRPLSEYVLEIYRLLMDQRHRLSRPLLCDFYRQNSAFFDLSFQRMGSYWNAYYRGAFPDIEDMPNVQFLRWLEACANEPPIVQAPDA